MNDTKTLAAELRRYNAWRLGDWAEPMPEPQEITKMIDKAADRLEELELDLVESRQWSSKLADVADDMRADLAAERALADRLASALTDSATWSHALPVYEAWKEARSE